MRDMEMKPLAAISLIIAGLFGVAHAAEEVVPWHWDDVAVEAQENNDKVGIHYDPQLNEIGW
jgi:hypothetical protein